MRTVTTFEDAHTGEADRLAHEGTRVTCTDVATGDSESVVIKDNHVVITDGSHYVSGRQFYPGSGTTVITVKTRKRD